MREKERNKERNKDGVVMRIYIKKKENSERERKTMDLYIKERNEMKERDRTRQCKGTAEKKF